MDMLDDVLKHYGVKGMKWGVRKDRAYSKGMRMSDRYKLKRITSATARKKYIDDKDRDWMAKVDNDKNIRKVTSKVASDMRVINKQLKKEYGSDLKRKFNATNDSAYNKAIKAAYKESLSNNTYAVYKNSPSRTREVKITPMPDGTLKAQVRERNTQKLNTQRQAIVKAADKRKKREESRTLKQSAITSSMSDIDGMFFLILPDEDGFPMDVITPFESDDIIQQSEVLDDVLQHFGVKGMRWGVRKDDKSSSKVGIRDRASSLKRERQWKKVLGEVDNMTNEQMHAIAKRVRLENDFKRLTKESSMAKASDKKDYIKRADMDDNTLQEKVSTLRVKDTLSKSVRDASKEQREFGEKVMNTGSSLVLKYATNNGKLDAKDIFDSIISPEKESKKKLENQIRDKAVQSILDSLAKNSR